jgi:hypothetical protein
MAIVLDADASGLLPFPMDIDLTMFFFFFPDRVLRSNLSSTHLIIYQATYYGVRTSTMDELTAGRYSERGLLRRRDEQLAT